MGDNPKTAHVNFSADKADLYRKVLPDTAELYVSEQWATDTAAKGYWRGFWHGYWTMLALAIFNQLFPWVSWLKG